MLAVFSLLKYHSPEVQERNQEACASRLLDDDHSPDDAATLEMRSVKLVMD